ncbi:carbohydrate-binding protein [Dyadobacter sp. CY323]|uniref:carbohydrate-binding protein n=1 Tax=Dyadobacter sp. CY323 TaxID=2907302 RepID=UPI001F21A60C|nr:carbohydrate-binding protein [Dyadobacter sp. CY323]MCE6988264.1 carbohydrate-binding protein [Dyadobacter sp. CY323]
MKYILLLLLTVFSVSAFAQTYRALSGKIEAESYDAIHGAGTETSEDMGGGMDVGWMNDSSWVDYQVNAPTAGFYTFKIRIANGFSDQATLQINSSDGTVLAQKVLPRTGGMQGWTTVTMFAALPAGNQTLRFYAEKGVFSFNWFEATPASVTLPGKIEAENFDVASHVRNESTSDLEGGMHVTDIDDQDWLDYNVNISSSNTYTFFFRVSNAWGNGNIEIIDNYGPAIANVRIPRTGGWQNFVTVSATATLSAGSHILRIHAPQGAFNLNWFHVSASPLQFAKNLPGKIESEDFHAISGIEIETTGDTGSGLNIGSLDSGDWMDYQVNVPYSGSYNFGFRVASANGTGNLQVKNAAGAVLGQINVPWTGGWQTYNTIETTINLTAGQQVLRLYTNQGGFNFNWLEATLGGTPVPNKIEAENFDLASNVTTENTQDVGGGMHVGSINDNDWLDYNIIVPETGTYSFYFRVANSWGNGVIEIKDGIAGPVIGQVSVPKTSGWQTFATVSTTASLSAGNHTIRLIAPQGEFNLNWIEIAGEVPLLTKTLPGKIEAENFDGTTSVNLETTGDADGALNIGSIDDGDWLDYHVNVQAAGTYTFHFRVATANGGGNLQIRNSAGSILGQIEIPWTGGWQTYQTISTVASLPAGNQLIRLHVNRGGFNFNWFEAQPGNNLPKPAPVISFGAFVSKTVSDAPFDLIATSTNNETEIKFASSNNAVVSVAKVGGSWKATITGIGTASITASQIATTSFSNVEVSQTLVVDSSSPSGAAKIAIDGKRWYQLTNAAFTLEALFDGVTQVNLHTGWGKILNEYEAYYPLLEGEEMSIESIKFFDLEGSTPDNPFTLSVITDQWERIQIASFKGYEYNGWVGPNPDNNATGNAKFKLPTAVGNIRYLVLNIKGINPTEIELYGSYTPPTQTAAPVPHKSVKLGDTFGVNGYEWNFELGIDPGKIHEPMMEMAKSFSGFRHYMDWQKLEHMEGSYSFNPTIAGGWNYDVIYERCKAENIEVLACLKTLPDWMLDTYPPSEKDSENVPVRFGKDFSDPLSYIEQARVGFQYAARYGSNAMVDPALVSTHNTPRWNHDTPNEVKIGLNLVKYMECDNERDKWWKGRKGYQTAREYAANLSAFYDGHKNTMGAGVGIKNADPNMNVVIAGLVTGPDYVKGMVDWCKEFRGYHADGTVNLCWDIVNFHLYIDNGSMTQSGTSGRGSYPEIPAARKVMDDFVKTSHEVSNGMPVWLSETGYDVNQGSPLKAIPIGNKSELHTQADWILRTSLVSARAGIEKVFYYQMYDDNASAGMFGTTGLLNLDNTRRPAADYLYQVKKQFGEYLYKETLHNDPIVDRYELNGTSLFVLTVPDEIGRTEEYELNLAGNGVAKVYTPRIGSTTMALQELPITNGKVKVIAGETPIFVIGSNPSNARTAATESAAPVLITEDQTNVAVTVYPNPTTDFISVDLSNQIVGSVEIKVFDASSGRLHYKSLINKTGSKFSHKVNLSNLPASLYIVQVSQEQEHSFRKVAKLH